MGRAVHGQRARPRRHHRPGQESEARARTVRIPGYQRGTGTGNGIEHQWVSHRRPRPVRRQTKPEDGTGLASSRCHRFRFHAPGRRQPAARRPGGICQGHGRSHRRTLRPAVPHGTRAHQRHGPLVPMAQGRGARGTEEILVPEEACRRMRRIPSQCSNEGRCLQASCDTLAVP